MGLSQELMSSGTGIGREAIGAVSGAVILAGTAFKAIAKVSEGEMGVRTRFDKATRTRGSRAGQLYGIVGPGYHPVVPFTHSIKPVNVQDRSNDLSELFIDRDEQYSVRSSITWRVSPEGDSPYRALYNVRNETDLNQAVTNMCLAGLREVMTSIDKPLMNNSHEVFGGVNEICGDDLFYYGVELRKLNIHSVARTIGEMLRPRLLPPDGAMQLPNVGIAAVAMGDAAPELRLVQPPNLDPSA